MASRSFAGVILYGRPPLRPRARAEARPARVRSEMSSRSNSARAAKIPKTSFPEAVVVSMAAPCPLRTGRPVPRSVRSWTIALCQVVDDVNQKPQVSTEPVKLPDNQGVPVPQGLKARDELRAVVFLSRGHVFVERAGVDAGGQECIALQVRGGKCARASWWLIFTVLNGVSRVPAEGHPRWWRLFRGPRLLSAQ